MMFEKHWAVLVALLICLSTADAIRGHSGNLRRRKDGSLVYGRLSNERRDLAHWGGASDHTESSYGIPENTSRTKGSRNNSVQEQQLGTGAPEDNERQFTFGPVSTPAPAGKEPKAKKSKKEDSSDEEDIDAEGTFDCDDPSDPLCQVECDDPADPQCATTQAPAVAPIVTDQLDNEGLSNPPDFELDETPGDIEIEDENMNEEEIVSGGQDGQENQEADEEAQLNGQNQEDQGTSEGETGGDSNFPNRFVPGDNGHHFGLGQGRNPFSEVSLETPTTMDRSITPFKVAYALSGSLDEPDLDDGDYAELSDNTDLFLTQYFTEYFAEEPTEFREVEVLIQKTNDPLVVRYFVTASFAIPGNVPTMRNLFDRMDDAFSGEASRQFVSILNEMGSGNPFRNTRSVALINDTPVSATGTGSSGEGSERSPVTSSLPKLISIILGAGVLALVVAGLVWVCRKVRGNNAEHVANAGDDKRRELNVKKQPEILTSESRTIGYLQKIRNRYRDDRGSKTDLEEVSLDDYGTVGVDHGMLSIEKLQPTIAAENQERATELRVPVHRVDFMSDLQYPAPPSDDGVGDDDDNDTMTENQQSGSRNSSDDGYLSYLDMKTSFEEEDLRG